MAHPHSFNLAVQVHQDSCIGDTTLRFQNPVNCSDGWERHIVRFKDYHRVDVLHAAIEERLAHSSHWKLLPRSNAAVDFPTDFAVVAFAAAEKAALSAALLSVPSVRDIHPDRTLRSLQHAEDKKKHAESNTAASLTAGNAGDTGKKQSGRLHTRWSIDHEQHVSEIVADLKKDAAVIQARRDVYERVARGSVHTVQCGSPPCNGRAQAYDSPVPKSERHLMPWGELDSIDLEDSDAWEAEGQRRKLLGNSAQVATALGAGKLWGQGFRGGGIRVGTRVQLLRHDTAKCPMCASAC
jgi:hypothetical protein